MSKPKIPNSRKANIEHKKRTERYCVLIQQVYDKIAQESSRLASLAGAAPDRVFSFSDYPLTKEAIQKLQSQFMSEVRAIIISGTSSEWKESNLIQDLVAKKVLTAYTGTTKHGNKFTRYFQTNPESLKAFQQRKEEGMNLSSRVWNLCEQYKNELEEAITAAIAPGTSAMELAAQVKQYLKYPDKRFRRIKEKLDNGTIKWHLSKNAKSFHPGQGVYRSSARNAQRLARTEINMAYRTAEQERWKQFDFVVGYEVKTTQNGHHVEDICDRLAGKYPKDFVFKGWHPCCCCYTIPILKTEEEFWALDEDKPSVNEVTDVPANFKEWIADNSDRIEKAEKHGKLPYFILDNKAVVEIVLDGNAENKEAETKAVLRRRPEEDVRKELYSLLKEENSLANPKLLRMMLSKEFTENGYSIVDFKDEYVTVEMPSGLVRVHLRHGVNELYENLEFAEYRQQKHGYEIDLCEKYEDGKGADSFNRTLDRFEEYKRNKKGTGNSLDMNLRDAAKQADVIVLEVPKNTSLETLAITITNRTRRTQNVREIIILMNKKEAIYNRAQFRKNGFKIQPGDFK